MTRSTFIVAEPLGFSRRHVTTLERRNQKETAMNHTNDSTREEDLIVLGVASVETKGNGGFVEANGVHISPVISEE